MSIHNTFEGAQFVAQASSIAKENGISVQIGTCFSEYKDLVSTYRGHQPVSQPFDCEKSNLDTENGFWIVGWNENGELIHTQAMRLIDLCGMTLSCYLTGQYSDFPPAGIDLDFAKSHYNPGPSARRIKGKVCYHGDLWLSSDYRGTGLVNILARLALASCHLRWAPEYIIGFMIRNISFRGLAEREGYMHSEPGALFWHLADSEKFYEAFMVWMACEDIRHLLTIPLNGLVSLPMPQIHKEAA